MRTWPGLAAIGAGLIHLGMAAGAAPLQLVLFALAGAAEAGWGVIALSRPVPRPTLSLAAAVVLVAGQIAVLLSGSHAHDAAATVTPGSPAVPLGPMLGGMLLDLVVTALLAVRLRRGSAVDLDRGAVRFLIGAGVGAAAVAVVTATSLAGTAVGGHHLH